MALLDIGYVTKSVITLIEQAFEVSSAWTNPSGHPKVLPEPPNRIDDEGIGFYLYHVQENAHYKNTLLSGYHPTIAPVGLTPMALNLYYQLSANSIKEDGTGAFQEQLMMSVAMKALHDYPEISDTTTLNGVRILPTAISGNQNRFKIVMQPMPYSEAVQYWTAGTSPLKLAAYYEVSVVLLEPELATSAAGRVLSYGISIFTEGVPRLIGSQNIIEFDMPPEGQTRQLKAQPAQVAAGQRFSFFATGISGAQIDILLIHPRWSDKGVGIVPFDDGAWQVQVKGQNEISLTVQKTIRLLKNTHLLSDTAFNTLDELLPDTFPVLPGIYAALIRVSRQFQLSDGSVRTIRSVSNQFPIIITPKIDTLIKIGTTTLKVEGFGFQGEDLNEAEVQVYVGNNRYTANIDNTPATFEIIDAANMIVTLEENLDSGQFLPFRLIISGAESAPFWIETD